MSQQPLELVIDGGPHRGGAIPAELFAAKLKSFVATLYALDRAYSGKDSRQIDVEIVNLTRNSPARVVMKVRAKTQGYNAEKSVEWSFHQLNNLQSGRAVDKAVTQIAVDNVIDLATFRRTKNPEVTQLRAVYGATSIELNDELRVQALRARSDAHAPQRAHWRGGVSKGSVFGELRGVVDIEGERQFFIVPPTGPDSVECVFPEDLRDTITDLLYSVVRVHGFLHYSGQSAHPYLLEARSIEGIRPPAEHFSDLKGLFKDQPNGEPLKEWG